MFFIFQKYSKNIITRFLFQALIKLAVEELCETADALIAPVRMGVARPTAPFTLASSTFDVINGSEELFSVEPLAPASHHAVVDDHVGLIGELQDADDETDPVGGGGVAEILETDPPGAESDTELDLLAETESDSDDNQSNQGGGGTGNGPGNGGGGQGGSSNGGNGSANGNSGSGGGGSTTAGTGGSSAGGPQDPIASLLLFPEDDSADSSQQEDDESEAGKI